MPTLNLRIARSLFETDPAVIQKVAKDGEFVITAGTMAKQNLPDKATYVALADAIGEETPLFRFRPSPDGRKTPLSASLAVFSTSLNGDGEAKVYGLDLEPIDVTFGGYKLGPGGYALVQIGEAVLEVEIPVTREVMDEMRVSDSPEEYQFPEGKGKPPTFLQLTKDGPELQALRPCPQREIPPWSEEVPIGTELRVLEILNPTREYDQPRLKVQAADGSVISGLIATGPIRTAIGVRRSKGYEITRDAIGESFVIVEVLEVRDRDGNSVSVSADDSRPQRTVVVRRTTEDENLDLSL